MRAACRTNMFSDRVRDACGAVGRVGMDIRREKEEEKGKEKNNQRLLRFT